jgi:hypothetical protein
VASRMLPPHKSATATASAVRRFGRGSRRSAPMIGTTSRGPGIVISAGGLFSPSMSSDFLSGESSGGDPGKYARRPRIIDRSVKPVVPRSSGPHVSGFGGREQGWASVTAQYCEQCQVVHNLGHVVRAVARDLHRSQVGIFLADSYDLLFVSAVGENLADELRDRSRHRRSRGTLRRWQKLASHCRTLPRLPHGVLQLGRKGHMHRHDTRIPTQLLSPRPSGNRICFRAGSSCKRQIQADQIRMVKTRKDTRCPITPPVVTDFGQSAREQDLW